MKIYLTCPACGDGELQWRPNQDDQETDVARCPKCQAEFRVNIQLYPTEKQSG